MAVKKIITYNVNGFRAALNKGLSDWIKTSDPDIICFQEVKAEEKDVSLDLFRSMGYHIYWHSAQKKGYSGVAIFTKNKPLAVKIGCGKSIYDDEGRVLQIDFPTFSVINVYMPSGSSGDHRQSFKMEWLNFFYSYIKKIKAKFPHLIISGDFNICHQSIDIHNPKSNAKSSGFLPEEREWLSRFLNLGFIDTFRFFNQEPHQYTWWTYRFNARAKNLGWRIDYNMATQSIEKRLKRAVILAAAYHSDHCPVLLELDDC